LDLEPLENREKNKNREPHSPYRGSWGAGQIEISEGEWTSGVPPMKAATTIEKIEAFPWPDMVASVHTIMNDVPAENVLALVNAVEKYGQYPLKK